MKYNFDEPIKRENTNCLKYDFRKTYFGTTDVIPMWVADMDFRIAPQISDALKERTKHDVYGYALKPKSFYTAIVNWMQRRHKWEIKADQISFSPGIVPALSFSIHAYTKPGDEVIMFTPVYPPFLYLPVENGRRLITSELKLNHNKYTIDFEDFEKKITTRTKMLFLCNPHNPVGRVWTKEELKRVAEICIKKNVIIIADEIHSDLIMPGFCHIPTASISNEIAAQTVTFMAPSKTFNLASLSSSEAIIQNKQLKHEFDVVINNFHIGMGNVFGIVATEAAYNHGDEWLDELITYLWDNYLYLKDYFEKHIQRIKVVPLEGTYLVWLDCRELKLSQKELRKFFIEKAKVGLNDGDNFGSGGKGFMRINIAATRQTITKAMKQIETAVNKL